MKIVVNNIKKTKHEDFSDYLKRKWEARDSSNTDEQDFETVRPKPGNANGNDKAKKKSSRSL
jgi:hypothetical protein